MSFEFEKKFILAVLSGLFLFLGGIAVFYFFVQKESRFAIEGGGVVDRTEIKNDTLSEDDKEKDGKIVKVLFGGDMMFDRYIRTVSNSKGFDYIIGDLGEILLDSDFVVANLEGPITDNESKSVDSELGNKENYIFTFPKETAQELQKHNISVVNIGNNHILNFGQDGLEQTRNYLRDAGMKYFGDPENVGFGRYVKEYNGIKIGFVCYNQFLSEGDQRALEDIDIVKKNADFVVVYAHWGVEYETHSNENQQKQAHEFVDAGVDLVIGSHPHVVQEKEEYKGKMIYYSLGNFIFDQYFEDATKKGLLVEATISDEGVVDLEEFEVEMSSNGKTSLAKK